MKLAHILCRFDDWLTHEPNDGERDETADREARRRFTAYLGEQREKYEREIANDPR